jgi:hypothetical protein
MRPDNDVLDFVRHFADRIVARDFAGAHGALAPWLRAEVSPDDLAATIDAEVQLTREACGESDECKPETYEIDWNSISLASLKEHRSVAPLPSVSDEITDDNFRNWVCVQLMPSEEGVWELDAFVDMWLMVVALDTGYAVGYYEMLEPD